MPLMPINKLLIAAMALLACMLWVCKASAQTHAAPRAEVYLDIIFTCSGRQIKCSIKDVVRQEVYFSIPPKNYSTETFLPVDSIFKIIAGSRSSFKIIANSGEKISVEKRILTTHYTKFLFQPSIGVSGWFANENPATADLLDKLAVALQYDAKASYIGKYGVGVCIWGDARYSRGTSNKIEATAKHHAFGAGIVYYSPFRNKKGFYTLYGGAGLGCVELTYASAGSQASPPAGLSSGKWQGAAYCLDGSFNYKLAGRLYIGMQMCIVYGQGTNTAASVSTKESLTRIKAGCVLSVLF